MRFLSKITDDLPPKSFSIFLLIFGMVIGTVFTFGNLYWNNTVSREDALHVTAHFASYKVHTRRGNSQDVIIRFSDHKQLDIDTYCTTDEVIDMIDSLESGTELEMYVHSNSDTILEMRTGDKYILRFNDSMGRLKGGKIGYLFIGGFSYLVFLYGLFSLIYPKFQGKKQ